MNTIRKPHRPRIGLYSVGLKAYWPQFSGLHDRLLEYNTFIADKLSSYGEVFNFGMVDDELIARQAGEYLNASNVDIVFCHAATYFTSACILPIHQHCSAPAIILNLQPASSMDYEHTSTGEWLAQCVACPIPEAANAFNRAEIPFRAVNGLLGLDKKLSRGRFNEDTAAAPAAQKSWQDIAGWCRAAGVKRTLAQSRFGFLGGYYSGMLDMYSDLTMLQAQTGMHVEILEMCDLEKRLRNVTAEQTAAKRKQIESFFEISGDSPSDPIAKKPTPEQLEWASRVAAAQEQMVIDYQLDALAYYYHGQDNYYEEIQSGFIVGHSLLTAAGIPCAGEGDIKTALAMKICDIIGVGGSFCEIVAADYDRGSIVIGHDGPFHFHISDKKPILRGMGVYHGKRGSGISVEAKVRQGDITTLGVTQMSDGKLQLNISRGTAIDAPILLNGNTSTHVRFPLEPAAYMDRWFAQAPTHHCALAVGDNTDVFVKVAQLMNIRSMIIT